MDKTQVIEQLNKLAKQMDDLRAEVADELGEDHRTAELLADARYVLLDSIDELA